MAETTEAPAPSQRARGRTPIKLSSGHVVVLDLPVPMSAEEVLELMVVVPGVIANLNLQVVGGVAGRVALPGGGAIAVRATPDRPA